MDTEAGFSEFYTGCQRSSGVSGCWPMGGIDATGGISATVAGTAAGSAAGNESIGGESPAADPAAVPATVADIPPVASIPPIGQQPDTPLDR